MKGDEGIMSAVDFEKAFGSLSLDFLFKCLELLFLVSPLYRGLRRFIRI